MISFRSEGRPRWRLRLILLVLLLAIPFLLASPKPMTASMVADSENGTKVLVLNYHKVDNMNISLSVLPEDFDRQMKYLSENGYHTITPDELYDSLAGNAELPENPVLITFDDGYEDNYQNAYPILKKYDFKATVFVISSFLGVYPNYLTWDQAREMDENGISIQSHTVDHKSMTDLTDDELRTELVDSKKKIEKNDKDENLKEAYASQAKRKITDIRAGKTKGVFEAMVYSVSQSAFKNEDAKKIFIENANLNMDTVVEHCEVMYTFLETLNTLKLIKIDEGSNLGAVRIRIRSLISAVKERRRNKTKPVIKSSAYNRVIFTEEMRKNYTINLLLSKVSYSDKLLILLLLSVIKHQLKSILSCETVFYGLSICNTPIRLRSQLRKPHSNQFLLLLGRSFISRRLSTTRKSHHARQNQRS